MVGKGWTWIGSDGATATMFKSTNNLQRAMQGMVGFRPKAGSGKLFHDIFTEWLQANPMADKQVCSYCYWYFKSVKVDRDEENERSIRKFCNCVINCFVIIPFS